MIGDTLDWVASEGFERFFRRFDNFGYGDAEEYRQRYLTRAIRGLVST